MGAGSPENFLGYADFDNTYSNGGTNPDFLHDYSPHESDWTSGDPTWQDGKGTGIVGAINYLAGKGINSQYLLTFNVDGDGDDVWPWLGPYDRYRYDVSKLAQWETVFEHMTRRGVHVHVLTQETENDDALSGGSLGDERKLYYRELVARFSHHPAVTWNLGEENTNTRPAQRSFAEFIHDVDPYDHPVTVHTYPDDKEAVYGDLVGDRNFEAASIQNRFDEGHQDVTEWIRRSGDAGRQWVCFVDEIGPYTCGVMPDGEVCSDSGYDQDDIRELTLWASLMGGGAGMSSYFGYSFPEDDLTCEDFRSRDTWWDINRHAAAFMDTLPVGNMEARDDLLSGVSGHVLADPGNVYAVFLDDGGDATVSLEAGQTYTLEWYNPRTGEYAAGGTLDGGSVSLGTPGFTDDDDVAAVIWS
jgi:hypothetical protein